MFEKKLKPIVKFNGGNPIALCNRCFIIMCSVGCRDEDSDCIVTQVNEDDGPIISTKIGEVPPVLCNKCKELLSYSLNE